MLCPKVNRNFSKPFYDFNDCTNFSHISQENPTVSLQGPDDSSRGQRRYEKGEKSGTGSKKISFTVFICFSFILDQTQIRKT